MNISSFSSVAGRQRIGSITLETIRPQARRVSRRVAPKHDISATSSTALPTATAAPKLAADIRTTTAVLQLNNGQKDVYVLGVSHCSKESLRHIQELIAAVQPDAVLVEVCKDRTGLLVDENAPPPQRWHAPRVTLAGTYRPQPGWPTATQLAPMLKAYNSGAVSASDIEDDAVTLLNSGLFGSVRPIAKPGAAGVPAFIQGPKGELQTVAPLASINFFVSERQLPPLKEFVVQFESGELAAFPPSTVDSIVAAAKSPGKPALHALLDARAALLEAAGPHASHLGVTFSGLKTGIVRAKLERQAYGTTGLEGSVKDGAGVGIQPFVRQARPSPPQAASSEVSSPDTSSSIQISPWTEAELNATEQSGGGGGQTSSSGGLAEAFAAVLTSQYGKYQSTAGKTVGIGSGAAWQVAMAAAEACGASMVLLGDRPANTTGVRLTKGIWGAWAPFLLGAMPAAVASAIITSQALNGGPAGLVAPLGAASLPLVAALWPVVAPILEVRKFSQLSAADIEATVRIKEPLQDGTTTPLMLWGEDALLNWPGAMQPVIHERDEYMARAIAAAAWGRPEGLTPAYLRSVSSSQQPVWRYAMPAGGDPKVCPRGAGDGKFEMPSGGAQRIVAVVGTAHVRGMVAALERLEKSQGDVSLGEFV